LALLGAWEEAVIGIILSKEHGVFVMPPVRFDPGSLLSDQATPADALTYVEQEPTRVMMLRRDGTGTLVTIEPPATMVFPRGNAFAH
jgi:carotenoid cleavage dioxygenase-like enzyme